MSVLAPYSLRMISIKSLSKLTDQGEVERAVVEAIRLRDFGSDATFFGFRDAMLTVIVSSKQKTRNLVYRLIGELERAVKEKYEVDRKVRLVGRVEIDGDEVLFNDNPLDEKQREYYLRYKSFPLPCLEFRFFTSFPNGDYCDVILVTSGVPSIVGLLQLLAPLVDAYTIFQPLLEEYGVRVKEAEAVEPVGRQE
jgi:hypothetical protein